MIALSPRCFMHTAVVALIAVLSTACGSSQQDVTTSPERHTTATPEQNTNDPQIIVPWDFGGAGIAQRDVAASSVINVRTSGSVSICLDRPGQVTIDEIEPEVSAGTLRVEAFALIAPGDFREDVGPLPSGPAVLDKQCADVGGSFTDNELEDSELEATVALRLQVRKVSGETAAAYGLVLHYTSGGRPYEFSLPWSITLCAPDDTTTRPCGDPG